VASAAAIFNPMRPSNSESLILICLGAPLTAVAILDDDRRAWADGVAFVRR
jgi:hypothetical protein